MNQIKIIFALWILLLSACSPEDSHAKDNDVIGDEDKEQVPDVTESKVNPFNFETKTVKLNSGYEMPIIGIQLTNADVFDGA